MSESSQLPLSLDRTDASPSWVGPVLGEAVIRCDVAGLVLEALGPTDLLPIARDQLVGRRLAEIDAMPIEARVAWVGGLERAIDTQRPQIREYRLERETGPREFEVRFVPIDAGHAALVVRDVAERNRLRGRVEHVALHDLLTELPNLRALRERLEQWMRAGSRAPERQAPVALLAIDLDRFKQAVDLQGRSVGDNLLRVVAQRLLRIVHQDAASHGASDDDVLVVRLGGDQFAIACRLPEAIGRPDEAAARGAALANRVISALGEPTRLAGQMLFVRASVGLACAPFDAVDPATLFALAEATLQRAKQGGRNQYRRHGDDLGHGVDGAGLLQPPTDERALRAALSSREFLVVYQPKFELATSVSPALDADGAALAPGSVLSVEALVRWRTAGGALLVPHQFLPLAESSGMIRPLGDWVLRTALTEVVRFAATSGVQVGVSVNVSLSQLHDRAFVQTVQHALAEGQLSPGRLTLELAETAFVEDIRLVSDTLAELSALGVRLAVDHFGVGTAGLVALKSLPVDEIKIDRTFIAGAAIDAFDATIVAGLIDMAHNLGIRVTAEGVERVDQIASLSQMRCDAIQGYFIGEPMTAPELFALERLWRKSRSG